MKKKVYLIKSLVILLISFLYFFAPGEGSGEIYKYIDSKGIIHFTDRFESIPKEYRHQIRTIKEVPSPQISPTSIKENEKEKEDLKKPEPQTIETAPSKSAQVDSPVEEKIKAREEKERQIAELKNQIAEKRKQQKGLRTNWMVYDRYAIVRLNQEIEALEKQIKTLQSEMEEER